MVSYCLWLPVLILLQQHLFCAAIGPKHRHEDLSVCPGVLHVSRYHRHLVDNLCEYVFMSSGNNKLLPLKLDKSSS